MRATRSIERPSEARIYMIAEVKEKEAEKNERAVTAFWTRLLRGLFLRRMIPREISSAAIKKSG
jgi:hypothetical protein